MIGRLALRSLTAHPIRSAVLAAGFGVGVAVMAILLGVAEVVLTQAQSPALVGGGDVIVRLSPQVPAQLLLYGTLQADALRERIDVASPSHATDLYLFAGGRRAVRVAARGGIPELERSLGDPETATVDAWRNTGADQEWMQRSPALALRQVDRFHPIPDAPEWASSWAEWLYFNGRSPQGRFYLTFLVGPRLPNGLRSAGVRLQLERDGRMQTYSASSEVSDADVAGAPDLRIGGSSVRLEGMRYVIHLEVSSAQGTRASGDVTLEASAGRLVPPLEVTGARGWRTGYVVPVMSGALGGSITDDRGRTSFDGGSGYHDHNWGFWQDVSWQWGQAQHDDVSFIYGRVFPPPGAADPARMPGFVGALGPDGPLGYTTDVTITEENDAAGNPRAITVRARGTTIDLTLRFDVSTSVTTSMMQGRTTSDLNFLQLRGTYRVTGRAANRELDFTAAGSAETFRGPTLIAR